MRVFQDCYLLFLLYDLHMYIYTTHGVYKKPKIAQTLNDDNNKWKRIIYVLYTFIVKLWQICTNYNYIITLNKVDL